MDWIKHITMLTQNLYTLQQEGKLCDTVFRCSNGIVKAHSAVLSSSCSTLQNLLTQTNMQISAYAFSCESVKHMMTYLYTGAVSIEEIKDLSAFYEVANSFGLESRFEKIRFKIHQNKEKVIDKSMEISNQDKEFPDSFFQELSLLDYKQVNDQINEPMKEAVKNIYTQNDSASSFVNPIERKTVPKLFTSPYTIKIPIPRLRKHFTLTSKKKPRKPQSPMKKCQLQNISSVKKEYQKKLCTSKTKKDKRAMWREAYYKKKAAGTLKYQKIATSKLPKDRECNVCGIAFKTYRSLIVHKNELHNIPFSEEDIRRLDLQCPYEDCNYICARPVKMEYHKDAVHNNSEASIFDCKSCDKKFSCSKELKNHSKSHSALVKPCEICAKPLKGKYYAVHMNTVHNKDRMWQCPHCDYHVQGREIWLKFHLVTKHSDLSRGNIEIFRCSYCDYTAPKKQNVTRHMKVRHEIALGLRPKEAVCDICGKEFSEKGLMVAHRVRHTDPDKFKCSYCSYHSPDYRSFENHVRTQHTQKDVKPWKCDMCQHATKERGNLKKHFRSKHKLSEIEANLKMKLLKPDTIKPKYIPLSSYKEPDSMSTCILSSKAEKFAEKECLQFPILNKAKLEVPQELNNIEHSVVGSMPLLTSLQPGDPIFASPEAKISNTCIPSLLTESIQPAMTTTVPQSTLSVELLHTGFYPLLNTIQNSNLDSQPTVSPSSSLYRTQPIVQESSHSGYIGDNPHYQCDESQEIKYRSNTISAHFIDDTCI